jgi:membrane-associated two-gene conflict system component 1 (EACC1)
MAGQADALELTLSTCSDRFDNDDDRWLAQESDLLESLRREVGGVRRDMVAVPGHKGLVESVILALGTAGAFTAAVDCLRAWLRRDRTRRVELSWTVDGREERIVLQGTAIDDDTFGRLAEVVRAKAADRP